MSVHAQRVRGGLAGVVSLAGLAMTCAASAGNTSIPNLSLTAGSGSYSQTFSGRTAGSSWSNGNGTFGFVGTAEALTDSPIGFTLTWNLLASTRPFIIGNMVLTNTGTTTQDFFVDLVLPLSGTISHSYVGASVSASVTDLNGNGATLSSLEGDGMFAAITAFGGPSESRAGTLLTAATLSAGPSASASFLPASFGTPIPSQLHGPVSENIAVKFRFSLTAGDSAAFTSIFMVEAVPAPGAIAILGLAGLTASRRRRR